MQIVLDRNANIAYNISISGNDGESGTRLLTESAVTAASRAEGVFTAPVLISCSAKNAAVSRVKGFEVGARF